MRSGIKRKVKFLWVLAIACLVLAGPLGALASTLSQGYISNIELTVGTAVSTVTGGNSEIEPASTFNESNLLGVVTFDNTSLISLVPANSTVQVAVSGEANVFVTDLAGEINEGDKLAASPIKGVAMKATDDSTYILGYAAEIFTTNDAINRETLTRENGETQEASIGLIKINVDPKPVDPLSADQPPLLFIGELIFGREISYIQLIASIVIFIMVIVVVGSVLYGAVYSSIISVGRNPLSRNLVRKDLVRAGMLSAIIMAAGIGGIVLLLNL